jgi:hypothetical protein
MAAFTTIAQRSVFMSGHQTTSICASAHALEAEWNKGVVNVSVLDFMVRRSHSLTNFDLNAILHSVVVGNRKHLAVSCNPGLPVCSSFETLSRPR